MNRPRFCSKLLERLGRQGPSDGLLGAPSSERRDCLTLLARRGLPLWSEQPEHCDGCTRELLVGEQAHLVCRGDELLLACSLCLDRLVDQGYLPVTGRAGGEAATARHLPLAG